MQKGITFFLDKIDEGDWTLTVKVKYKKDATPIAGAQVMLSETGTKVTDGLGYCVFEHVPEGEYTVEASATGYKSQTMPITVG